MLTDYDGGEDEEGDGDEDEDGEDEVEVEDDYFHNDDNDAAGRKVTIADSFVFSG